MSLQTVTLFKPFTKCHLQDDLQIQNGKDGFRLVGFVEGDPELEAIEALKPSKKIDNFCL